MKKLRWSVVIVTIAFLVLTNAIYALEAHLSVFSKITWILKFIPLESYVEENLSGRYEKDLVGEGSTDRWLFGGLYPAIYPPESKFESFAIDLYFQSVDIDPKTLAMTVTYIPRFDLYVFTNEDWEPPAVIYRSTIEGTLLDVCIDDGTEIVCYPPTDCSAGCSAEELEHAQSYFREVSEYTYLRSWKFYVGEWARYELLGIKPFPQSNSEPSLAV